MRDFLTRINDGTIFLLDGGLGSLLAAKGGSMNSGENNLRYPQIVAAAHREYLDAGADAVISNSFALNRINAGKNGMATADCELSLRKALELALAAAEDRAYVLGDIGPSGEMLKPYGAAEADDLYDAFYAQAAVMAEYPLTALIVETIFDLNEALIILRAAADAAPKLPRLLSMTFSSTKRGGCTMMGNRAADIARAAEQAGAAAVGANCGDLSPEEYAVIIAAMREATALPLMLQPNAGKPHARPDGVYYELGAADFALRMQAAATAGATLLGGCCGTTPAHIAALKAAFAAGGLSRPAQQPGAGRLRTVR